MRRSRCGSTLAMTFTAAAIGCTDPVQLPDADAPQFAADRSAERCVNVDQPITSDLSLWMLDGQLVPGAAPGPVNLGGIDGWLGSLLLVDQVTTHGQSETVHWALRHIFTTSAPQLVDSGLGFPVPGVDLASAPSWFVTFDRAVCAAAGGGPSTCRVNDILQVTDGAGIFDEAGGFLHNHGTITITDPVTGAGVGVFHLRGRICGAGLNG